MEPAWQREPEAALQTALRAGALPAESKQLAIGGTDLRVNLKSSFYEGAADRAAVFNSTRDALEQVCGRHIHTTVDHPAAASPHMTVAFRDSPPALEAKRSLAASGSLRVTIGGLSTSFPLRLIAGVKPPDCRVLIAHMPRGASQRHTDVWRVLLACAGYAEAAAACSASFFPCHAGRDSLDGARLLAYAPAPPDDPTFRNLPRHFSYDCGGSFVKLTIADQDTAVRDLPILRRREHPQATSPAPSPTSPAPRPSPPQPSPPPPTAAATPATQPPPPSPPPPAPSGALAPRRAVSERRSPAPAAATTPQAVAAGHSSAVQGRPSLVEHPPGILPCGRQPSKPSTIFGPQPAQRDADVVMEEAAGPSSRSSPLGVEEQAAALSPEEVDATELAQGLWFWAADTGAVEASRADVKASLHRMGRLHPGLIRQHASVCGHPPPAVQSAFLSTLALVNPAAAAAATAAEDGYSSESAAEEVAGEPPWQEVVGSRARRASRHKERPAQAGSSAPPLAPAATKRRGTSGRKAGTAGGGAGPSTSAPVRERHPRAAHHAGRSPYWAGKASASPVSAPTGSAGRGARGHGSR